MSFKDIALPLADRGIPVIPVQPGTKKCLLPDWQHNATTNKEIISVWDEENPNYNVGCVGQPDGYVILDCDVKGLIQRIEAETHEKMPRTFAVKSAGKGCAHLYFKQTMTTRHLGNRSGKNLFDLRSNCAYVVGPGSSIGTNGDRKYYEVIWDDPIVEFPNWLAEWVDQNSSQPKLRCQDSQAVSPNFDIDAFLEHYGLDYDIRGDWYITDVCPVAKRKHEQSSQTGFYFDGRGLGFHCFASGCPGFEMSVGKVIHFLNQEHAPYTGIIWEDAPCFSDGNLLFADEADYKKHLEKKNAVAVEVLQTVDDVKETEFPKYPNVWKGTIYDEFAETCQRGNKIPREFFIESVKTVMGALMGSSITVQGEGGEVKGVSPRFYTVLIAKGQGGKGTSLGWTLKAFEHLDQQGNLIQASPLWYGSIDPAEVPWKVCGACHSNFNSVPGLGKLSKQRRLLQTYGELSMLINHTAMEASGEGLLAILRDLYDDTRYHVGATARRDPFSGYVEHSLLAGTTPELWKSMFSKGAVEGSGLFQRFNVIPVERVERVTLYNPPLNGLRAKFFDILQGLEAEPITMVMPSVTVRRLDDWFNPIANGEIDPEISDDDFGRLDVLARRNALHLTFMRGKREIGLAEIDDAIALSTYQYAVRLRYKSASGENPYARCEDELRILVRSKRKTTLREAKRSLRKHGSKAVDFAVAALEDEVRVVETTPPGGGPVTKWLVYKSNR